MIFSKIAEKFRSAAKSTIPGGQFVQLEAADRIRYGSLGEITPERLGEIISAADQGDIEYLMRASLDIQLVNWDIQHAFNTRRNALSGVQYDIAPADPDNPRAVELAEELKKELKKCSSANGKVSFYQLRRTLAQAIISPFAAAEIVWTPGGGLGGFVPLDGFHFSCRNSQELKLITKDYPNGLDLVQNKFVIHRLGNTVDIVRDGHIRTLAWLHVFQNYPIKDLAAFVERYGMPFVVAKVGSEAWENDRDVIRRLIRNFGPSGGGVFSKAVEVELLQAASTGGDVYFRLLDYTGSAITKVLLGQTASSGDSSGLSGGDAQSSVRQDILDADGRAIEDTINTQIFLPWTLYRCGDENLAPVLKLQTTPEADLTPFANMVLTLYNAGFECDPDEVGERVGLTLKRRENMPQMAQNGIGMDYMDGGSGLSDRSDQADASDGDANGRTEQTGRTRSDNVVDGADATVERDKTLNLKSKYDAMGMAIRAGLLTATPEIESQVRAELGLPAMTDEVKLAWEATGGIRQPITLKSSESAAVKEALEMSDQPDLSGRIDSDDERIKSDSVAMSADSAKKSILDAWLGDLADELIALGGDDTLSDDDFIAKLNQLADKPPISDDAFAAAVQREMQLGYVAGMRKMWQGGAK